MPSDDKRIYVTNVSKESVTFHPDYDALPPRESVEIALRDRYGSTLRSHEEAGELSVQMGGPPPVEEPEPEEPTREKPDAPMLLDDFGYLLADEQREVLAEIGITDEESTRNKETREAAYKAYLES